FSLTELIHAGYFCECDYTNVIHLLNEVNNVKSEIYGNLRHHKIQISAGNKIIDFTNANNCLLLDNNVVLLNENRITNAKYLMVDNFGTNYYGLTTVGTVFNLRTLEQLPNADNIVRICVGAAR